MSLNNNFSVKSLAGIVLGFIVGLCFWVADNPTGGIVDNKGMILHLIVSAVLGMICMGSSVVYEFESWGILKITITHYLICMSTFTLSSLLLHWFEGIGPFLLMCAIMTVCYAGIWVGEYLYWKFAIGELNEELKALHNETFV